MLAFSELYGLPTHHRPVIWLNNTFVWFLHFRVCGAIFWPVLDIWPAYVWQPEAPHRAGAVLCGGHHSGSLVLNQSTAPVWAGSWHVGLWNVYIIYMQYNILCFAQLWLYWVGFINSTQTSQSYSHNIARLNEYKMYDLVIYDLKMDQNEKILREQFPKSIERL